MKHYKVIFSSRVINDIEEGVVYYNEQKHNLGNRFAKEVQVTLSAIRTNPYYFSFRYSGIRCANVKAFPFLVHYNVDESTRTINILAVYNTHRKPLA